MSCRSPRVAAAIPQMMSTSERSSGPAGSERPREACTADIESSTVIRCTRPPVRSCSVRPRVGRISAVCPASRWLRLSLVEICTVSSALRIAAAVTSVSDIAATKLPPSARNTLARPSRNTRTASAASTPCSRGGSKPNSSRSRSRKTAGGFSQIPMLRSPCTFECPRTGQRPAPGLPIMPWSRAMLTNSLIVATALRCWVMPIAQQWTIRELPASMSAAASISAHSSPVAAITASRSTSATCFAQASKPTVDDSMNSRSATPRASSRLPIACQRARSPFERMRSSRSASPVPPPTRPRAFCGLSKRSRPASGSGLIARIFAPSRFAISSAVSIRGWLVPGFWPETMIRSAWCRSSRVTEPLPTPIVRISAEPVDSWHMFEQSGRLLVPSARAKS